jgi:nucleotide-binding universal stress UspA family protein
MYETILVALDGSAHSDKALSRAIELAEKYQAELLLFHAAVMPPVPEYQGRAKRVAKGMYHDIGTELGNELLDAAEAKAREAGRTAIRRRLAFGNPAREIIKAVEEEKVGLTVTGTRGVAGFSQFVLGSVVQKVAALADCHVLVVK